MATEFQVQLKDRPGTLAALANALGDAKVNLRSIGGQKGLVGFVVSDKEAARARRALKKGGYRAKERDAIEMRLDDRPGSLARAATRFGKKGVNIASAYVLGPGRGKVAVAFVVKDARKAKRALGR